MVCRPPGPSTLRSPPGPAGLTTAGTARCCEARQVPSVCRPPEPPDAAKPPNTQSCPLCAFPHVRSTFGRAAGQSRVPGGFSLTLVDLCVCSCLTCSFYCTFTPVKRSALCQSMFSSSSSVNPEVVNTSYSCAGSHMGKSDPNITRSVPHMRASSRVRRFPR